ncbi:hypothetical protein MsAg5_14260 [Methanosarcinaceae archaeon Ag5]|uniref:ATP-dependent endonuclease n=1 Tax=Methanolapillus africanus TaxID=3028297 RepID=A0AAE4MKB6_9EURY|nr:hypothetical protein [Methanosarcinaceae archaeon Ag5]
MYISEVNIKGFRNFENTTINLTNKTLIIGANDIGKTNFIYALRIIFDKSLNENDLELYDTDYNAYTEADEIEITVCLSGIVEDCLKSHFGGDIKDGKTYIRYKNNKKGNYQIYGGYDINLLELKQGRNYLKCICIEYVDTNRDLYSFIRRERAKLLATSKDNLNDSDFLNDQNSIEDIQKDLNEINEKVDNLNYIKNALSIVNDELNKLSVHNEDQNISFVAGKNDAKKMLDNLDLAYLSTDKSPLLLGGDGRNNQIFLATWSSKQKMQKSSAQVTIFAIEEPEAHLHPHQQRKLSKYLLDIFEEQVLITTHSPHIASNFRPDKIVRIYAKNKISCVAQGGCSKNLGMTFEDFGYRLNAITSELFFCNGVFLVEGPSEKMFYTALSQKIGIDIDRFNLSIISVEGISFKPYIKVCKALDIPFVMRTDNDIYFKDGTSKFSGLSRAVGIYNELISSSRQDPISQYWIENKSENEWNTSQIPPESLELNKTMREKLKTFNIFLSNTDLEYDLVESKLKLSLSIHYNEKDNNSIVKRMQKNKAENMLEYLEKHYDTLYILKNDDILLPLKKLVSLIAPEVHPLGVKANP